GIRGGHVTGVQTCALPISEGIEFPFPEYTNNIITQIAMRWQRPLQATPLEAEIGFLIHRDGSVSDMQFIKRSGNFGFDLEAQGRSEERRVGKECIARWAAE